MMETLDLLVKILEVSKKKYGAEAPLTLGHFSNILKLAQKFREREEIEMSAIFDDIVGQDKKWGSD